MPERPWQSASQVSSTVCPRAVISPMPVMTTRFIAHTPLKRHPVSSLPDRRKNFRGIVYYSVQDNNKKKPRLLDALSPIPLILHQRKHTCPQGGNHRGIIATFG